MFFNVNFIFIKKRKMLFYEIPLLIESKLTKYFDVIIFIKAQKKNLKLKEFFYQKLKILKI